MKRSNSNKETVHIGDAIRELLHSYHIDAKFDQATIVASWERIVGKPVSRRTKRVFIKKKCLYVELDSPALKQDFSLNKHQVLAIFKKEFGDDVISEIVLL